MLIERLSINATLNKSTIFKLPAVYRTDITRNLLGLLEARCVYYEAIPTVTKHICRIIVTMSLRHITFNLMHTTYGAEHMGECKTLY